MDMEPELQQGNKPVLWDIYPRQLLMAVGCYLMAGLLYWLVLLLTSQGAYNAWDQTILNFGLKGLLSLPVYWVVFVRCGRWPLQRQLWLHVLTMPIYVAAWFFLFRWLADFFSIGYLIGSGAWWDVYIPMLLYMIQFSTIHAFRHHRNALRQQQISTELKAAALRSEMNALKAQINPHFLFNTLNSISASLPPQQERTRELIAGLADTFRFALRASEQETVTLQEEMDFLETYLRLEQQRFGDRLRFDVKYPPALAQMPIPPMLLQPLVENAVKHAVSPSVSPVGISIVAAPTSRGVHISVEDTGAGWQTDSLGKGFGIGLRNTQRRIEQQYGSDLRISTPEAGGVRVDFELPLTTNHSTHGA